MNVKAKGIDLTELDFALVSHRHGDHTSGLNHLMTVNPSVKIYAPKENFGDRYLYAGLGTTLVFSPSVKTVAETGQPQMQAMDEQDLHGYRELLAQGHDNPGRLVAHSRHDAHRLTAQAKKSD